VFIRDVVYSPSHISCLLINRKGLMHKWLYRERDTIDSHLGAEEEKLLCFIGYGIGEFRW